MLPLNGVWDVTVKVELTPNALAVKDAGADLLAPTKPTGDPTPIRLEDVLDLFLKKTLFPLLPKLLSPAEETEVDAPMHTALDAVAATVT